MENPYKNLEIKPGLNARQKYEIGQYESGEWVCYYETSDPGGAVIAVHFAELYRFLDFIMYPKDYNTPLESLSLVTVKNIAGKIRTRIDSEIDSIGLNAREMLLNNKEENKNVSVSE